MGNDANTHGYAWSDGTIHSIPEPKPVKGLAAHGVADMAIADLAPEDQHIIAERLAANLGYKLVEEDEIEPIHTTQEQLDRAFAAWAKAFKLWEADYAAWKAKQK